MPNILRIMDKNTGEYVGIPAIKGDNGKSAYQAAVDGGFAGTEEEFNEILAGVGSKADLGEDGKVLAEQLPEMSAISVHGKILVIGGGSVSWLCRLTVTAPTGSTVTATKEGATLTATEDDETWVFLLPTLGEWMIHATLGSKEATETVTAVQGEVAVTIAYTTIYGAEWDGTSTTVWSRTDKSASFSDPVPYVDGEATYNSPFDNLMPWSGMIRVTDSVAGELVAIPKYWYKWTQNGNVLKLQIADAPVEGFYVSPAHSDRGDGKGERDIVYVGRYHCHTSNYKSQTRGNPKASLTRNSARISIHSLGSDVWQWDWAMNWTIKMLYLVEFADWNSQKVIGKGCGNNSNAQAMGYTDSMPYHTGTTQSNRDTYGCGTQYRYIEGLWDNVFDWVDGCYYNSNGLNIIRNPANFSDDSNGTNVGAVTNGWSSAFTISMVNGQQWLRPTAAGGRETTYLSDYWYSNASSPCLRVGGSYGQSGNYGLFYVDCTTASGAYVGIGCRLMKLP